MFVYITYDEAQQKVWTNLSNMSWKDYTYENASLTKMFSGEVEYYHIFQTHKIAVDGTSRSILKMIIPAAVAVVQYVDNTNSIGIVTSVKDDPDPLGLFGFNEREKHGM